MTDSQDPAADLVRFSTRKASSAEPTGKPQRFALVKFDDVLMTTTAFYLVKDLLPRSGLVVIWGPPKCGKSFWACDLLLYVSLRWEYRGLRIQGGHIVYIVLEGHVGFKRRIEAFKREHPESKGAPFYLMLAALDLIGDQKALIAAIRAQLPKSISPVAVCIDTLNRSLVGSESSDQDMAAYVRAADALRDAFDCCVPIIHHCGHNTERPRGHSSLLGAVDVQIAVKRDAADNIVATVEFAKDGATGLEIVSKLRVVEVGLDDDGDMMTSCVIEPVGEPIRREAADPKPKGLTNAAKNGLRALRMAVDELGEIPPASDHIPQKVRAVTTSQWRDYAFRLGISSSEKAHAKSTAFNRALDKLLAAGKIAIWEPYVWPVYEEER
jgi:hypothetical protein